jgi:hypothetical protein
MNPLSWAAGNYQELQAAINPADFADGNWHHVAATYNGTTKLLYQDGVQIGSSSQSGNIGSSGTANAIAASLWPVQAEFFNGTIDDVRVWRVARSVSDINTSMFSPLSGTEPGLAAYYKFDEGAGTRANDSGPGGLTGTLFNNPIWVASTIPPAPGPLAHTGLVSDVTTNAATLNGTAYPQGYPTTAYFEYGSTTNYGTQTALQDLGSAPSQIPVAATVSGLASGVYHYRLVVVGNARANYGADSVFWTIGPVGGTALKFNGTTAYVSIPVINLSANNAMTLEAWIKPANLTATALSEIMRQQSSGNPDWLLSFQNNGTILSFGLRTSSGYQENLEHRPNCL